MKTAVVALSALVHRAPRTVVAMVILLTAVLAGLATQVQTATGNEGFAPDSPEIRAAEEIAERFGSSGEQVLQILVTGDDVVSADGVAAVLAIREAVESTDAAAAALVESAERPAVLTYLSPVEQAVASGEVPPEALTDDAAVGQVFTEALAALPPEQAGFVTGLLPDGEAPGSAQPVDAGLVLVFLAPEDLPDDATAAFDRQIEIETEIADAVASAELPAGIDASPFSFALLFADTGEFEAEIARLFAAAFGIILAILAFVYWVKPRAGLGLGRAARRTAADVAMTMTAIVMAISWVNGFAALLGPGYADVIGGLTEITQIIPVLLIGLGVDYAIHLTSRYREEVGAGASVAEGMRRSTRTVGVALVLATVTTAVGFLTNIVNPVPALVDFGVLAAIGIGASFLLMLTFVPALRLVLDRRAEAGGRLPRSAMGTTSERVLPGIMARVAVLAERAPVPTLLVTVVLGGAMGGYGLTQLETRFSFTDFVSDDAPVVQTFDEIVERFGGGFGEQTQILLTGDVDTPAAHNALVAAQADLAAVDDVATFGDQAQASSPVSLLGRSLAPGGGQPPSPEPARALAGLGLRPDGTVADDADVTAIYAALAEASPEAAEQVLDGDARSGFDGALVTVQTTAGEGRAGELSVALDTAFAPVEATGVEATATSNAIINDAIVSALSDSQLSSLVITLVAAMLLLVLNFAVTAGRPFLGVVTIAPVALVVLWTFGMMAATGIPFGPVTATIAALAVGIGVPYTIHITHRYTEDRVRYADPAEAIRSTVRHTGGALAGSAFTTVAGFGILVTSTLTPFRQFGLVTAYAIGFALLAATVVLPSMLALWDRYHRRRDARGHGTQPTAQSSPEPSEAVT
ncbi:hypothetical protein BH23ACT8_BH23ACT8_15370 [soil metagenome]